MLILTNKFLSKLVRRIGVIWLLSAHEAGVLQPRLEGAAVLPLAVQLAGALRRLRCERELVQRREVVAVADLRREERLDVVLEPLTDVVAGQVLRREAEQHKCT